MYSPKISEKHIPVLYELSQALRQPMTKLVNQAVENFLKEHKQHLNRKEEIESTKGGQETQ